MKNSVLIIAITCLLSLAACGEKYPTPSENYMVLDEIEYVKDFPIKASVNGGEDTGFDIIGLQQFKIIDTLLFASRASREGFWQFYSLNDGHLLGQMLSTGQGPHEFFMPVYSSNMFSIEERDGRLYATLFDNQKGEVLRLNISSSLESGKLDIRTISEEFSNTDFIVNAIDDQTFYVRSLEDNGTRQNRYLLKNNEKYVPEVFEKLNRAKVDVENDGYSFNLISVLLKRHGNLFLETPMYLNYINLYSLDGKISKTICTEDKVKSIKAVLSSSDALRRHTYTASNVFDKFFGVVFSNYTWMEEELGLANSAQIQLFDWEGKPLAAIDIDRRVSVFDIDFRTGYLYVFSRNTDEFVKYDIRKVLDQMNSLTN